MTRAVYGPTWPLAANRRRLDLLKRVTARSLASQTRTDFEWVVAVHPEDPLLVERGEALAALNATIVWVDASNDDPARQAALAYRAPWPREPGKTVITTRLDDDDALARDFVERLRRTTVPPGCGLVFPRGIRVYRGEYSVVRHNTNAWVSLVSDDGSVVYDTGHTRMHEEFPVLHVDRELAWLWLRHGDTLSGKHFGTRRPLTRRVRGLFDVDWAYLHAG